MSELATTFGPDGTLSGSSDCISYQAGYEVDCNNITIGLPFSTMMACAKSDGMMEQEQAYLTSLGTTAFHRPNLWRQHGNAHY